MNATQTEPTAASRKPFLWAFIIGMALAGISFSYYFATVPRPVIANPTAIMGTECTLVIRASRMQDDAAQAALAEAEEVIRGIEARMSSWIDDSQIGRFNSAAADTLVPLDAELLGLLRRARAAHADSTGAFDITCRPQLLVWRQAGESGRLPTAGQLSVARGASGWEQIELTGSGARKAAQSVCLDLGGIAKGWAIDRALAVLQEHGFADALVDIGGDIACSGAWADGTWPVRIRSPWHQDVLWLLQVPGGAVCTSGNYARFSQIEGRRFSHIIDPRTGQPAEAVPSASVIAADATTADIWATALSVLGPEGLALLPDGAEALLVLGTADEPSYVATSGMRDLLPELATVGPEHVRIIAR